MFTFVETALFTNLVFNYLTDDEYSILQVALAANPQAGAVILAPAVSANFDGASRDEENGAAFGSSTTCAALKVNCGC